MLKIKNSTNVQWKINDRKSYTTHSMCSTESLCVCLCVCSFLPFGADAKGINEMKSSTQAHVRWRNNKLTVGFVSVCLLVSMGTQLSLWLCANYLLHFRVEFYSLKSLHSIIEKILSRWRMQLSAVNIARVEPKNSFTLANNQRQNKKQITIKGKETQRLGVQSFKTRNHTSKWAFNNPAVGRKWVVFKRHVEWWASTIITQIIRPVNSFGKTQTHLL